MSIMSQLRIYSTSGGSDGMKVEEMIRSDKEESGDEDIESGGEGGGGLEETEGHADGRRVREEMESGTERGKAK